MGSKTALKPLLTLFCPRWATQRLRGPNPGVEPFSSTAILLTPPLRMMMAIIIITMIIITIINQNT